MPWLPIETTSTPPEVRKRDEVLAHVVGIGCCDRDAADGEVAKRVHECDRGRRRRDARRGRDRRHLIPGAVGAEYEAARRARPHHRVRLFIGEPGGAFFEPLVAAQVEQGVDMMRVLADRGDHHWQPHRAVDSGLERRESRPRRCARDREGRPSPWLFLSPHVRALSPWLIDTGIGRLSTMLTRGTYDVRRLAIQLREEIRGASYTWHDWP